MKTRRKFLRDLSCASVAITSAPYLSFGAKPDEQPKVIEKYEKDPIRLGFVGCGLMGGANMRAFKTIKQKLTAYCDVDTGKYGFGNARKYVDKDAQGFVDYREMFDKLAGKLDAVVISTPDHSHFAAAMCALKHGIPIYLEKPMCHNIRQIRELTKFAEEKGLATQMGNMVHSGDGIRYTKEWIASGLIGKVRKVIMWTTRPVGGCNRPTMAYKSWPSEPVPPTLDWDKWLNVADWGPFSSEIVPLNWRRVYKYGTGALGDIGTHILDVPMFALDLDYPTKITSRQTGGTEISVPKQDHITYYFDNSNQGEKVEIHWYSGFLKPDKNGEWKPDFNKDFLFPLPKEFTDTGRSYKDLSTADGMFIIGDEGVLYSPKMHLIGKPIVLPKAKTALTKNIPLTEPRIKYGNHRANFVEAVRGDIKKATSNLPDMAKLTEVVLLGNLTLRTGENVVWDAKSMRAIGGSDKMNSLIDSPMRPGWY